MQVNTGSRLVAVPADYVPRNTLRSPAADYLSELDPTSRKPARSKLDICADLLQPGTDAVTCNWQAVTAPDLRDLKARLLADGRKFSTVNSHLTAVKGVMRAAKDGGLIGSQQWQEVRDVRAVTGQVELSGRRIEPEEMAALVRHLESFGNHTRALRDLALVLVAASTAARREELRNLTVSDVNLRHGTVHILSGKGRRERTVVLHDWAKPALQTWLLVRGTKPGALFVKVHAGGALDGTKAHLTNDGMDSIQRRLMEGLPGLNRWSWHDYRRTAITEMLRLGSVEAAQRQAGHVHAAQTLAYSREDGERLEAIVRQRPAPWNVPGRV